MASRNPYSMMMLQAKLEREYNTAVNMPNSVDKVIKDEWIPPLED